MRVQHVHYQSWESGSFLRIYKGHGFWDLSVWRHRWRWFW